MSDELVPAPRTVKPHQVGWLRRPELDTARCEVWELPDGKLYAHEPGKKLELNVWRMPPRWLETP